MNTQLPSYNELLRKHGIYRPSLLRRAKCALGLHAWQTTHRSRCTLRSGNRFTGSSHEVPGEADIQECLHCPTEQAIITDGVSTQRANVNFIKRGMGIL